VVEDDLEEQEVVRLAHLFTGNRRLQMYPFELGGFRAAADGGKPTLGELLEDIEEDLEEQGSVKLAGRSDLLRFAPKLKDRALLLEVEGDPEAPKVMDLARAMARGDIRGAKRLFRKLSDRIKRPGVLPRGLVVAIVGGFQLAAAMVKGPKVTIYSKGPAGNVVKKEGFYSDANTGGVTFVPKRGRRETMIMTYYSPFIMVVMGWGKPDPEGIWGETIQSGPGATVQKGRYRGTDPRWVGDFLKANPALQPVVLFQDGKLKKTL
jgi:hypothetical protein